MYRHLTVIMPIQPGSSASGSPLVLSFCSLTLTVFHSPGQTCSLWAMNYSSSWASPTAIHPHLSALLSHWLCQTKLLAPLAFPQRQLRFPFSTPGVPFSPLSCFTEGLKGGAQNPLSLRQKVNNTCPVDVALSVLMCWWAWPGLALLCILFFAQFADKKLGPQ